MIKNYFVVAIRNLMRKKLYTFINVFGLGLGLACCILMTLFVKHEWTHDQFHEKHDQMFRLVAQRLQPDGKAIPFKLWDALYPLWVVDALKDDVIGVEQACAFMQASSKWTRIIKGEKTFQHDIGIVSTNFFQMFTFPLLVGDPETVLNRPDGMVITETIAHKFFGDVQDYSALIGQALTVAPRPYFLPKQNYKHFVVTGVMADVPTNSSLQFDVLVSTKAEKGFMLARKSNYTSGYIYVQIAETNAARVLGDLNHWPKKEKLREETFKKPFNFILQPLTDVYWNTDIPNIDIYAPQGNPTGVYILWGLAWLVLLIACSNFITLSVAESSGRAKEVGLRKVVGANRGQIIQQFWSEALVLCFLGLLVGTALAEILLPVFNGFVHQKLTLAYFDDWWVLLLLLGIVGLIAGSYPALVLSRFQPVLAMKGEARLGRRNLLTRTLIILQYAASIALIIGTGVMLQQQDYVRNKNLGFNKEQVAIIRANRQAAKPYKEAIVNDSRIASVTITDRTLTSTGGSSATSYSLPDGSKLNIRSIGVDVDYLSTLEISLLGGRNFSEDHPTDRDKAVLINETLAKKLGLENPVGETLTGFGRHDPVIIGMVHDFHIDPLHRRIEPLVLRKEKYNYGPFLMVRIRPGQMLETIDMLKSTWKKVESAQRFELSFLDESLNQQYANEIYWFRVLSHSALVAVLLSCLGLFGLASLAVARRTKEIGIRKVLGASIHHVMWLLSRDFIKLLLVANIIAYPVAYWMMNQWLTNFAYRIELGIGVFGIAGILTLLIALLTVNFQTLKAARRNPVDALRDE